MEDSPSQLVRCTDMNLLNFDLAILVTCILFGESPGCFELKIQAWEAL